MQCRRSLSLLEVLIAMLLVGGLLAVLLRGWVQLGTATADAQQEWSMMTDRESRLARLEDLFTHLVMPKEGPALSWDGTVLTGMTMGGYHELPQLSGPALFALELTLTGVELTLKSDPGLWGEHGTETTLQAWPPLESLRVRIFVQGEDGTWNWEEGPFEVKKVPLFLECFGEGALPMEFGVRILSGELAR